MAMEKKSLVSKKTAPATKSNSTKKVDTSKPAASKVVAAKSYGKPGGPVGGSPKPSRGPAQGDLQFIGLTIWPCKKNR